MKKMTRKKILDLVGFSMILAHNDALDDVLTQDEANLMMTTLKEQFNNDEQEVLFYLKQKVKAYKQDLVSTK